MDPHALTVEEFSTPNPVFVLPTDRLPEIWNLMRLNGIRHVLVKNQRGDILGIVSQRDVTSFSQAEDFAKIEAQEIMSSDVFTVLPDTKLYEVALKMSTDKIGSTVIHDPDTDYTGIFTATDALNALVEVLRGDVEAEDAPSDSL